MLFNEGSAGEVVGENASDRSGYDDDFEEAMEAHLYGETVEAATTRTESNPASTTAYVSRIRQLDRVYLYCVYYWLWHCHSLPKVAKLSWLYLLPAIWLLVNAYAITINGGKAFSELEYRLMQDGEYFWRSYF